MHLICNLMIIYLDINICIILNKETIIIRCNHGLRRNHLWSPKEIDELYVNSLNYYLFIMILS